LQTTYGVRKESRMDFNTGTGGTGSSGEPPPRSGGPSPGPSRSAAAIEFNLQDPVQSFIATVQAVVLRPVDFFRGILRQGDFLNPLIFALICALVSAILGGIIGFLFSIGATDQGVIGAFAWFIFAIIRGIISVAIGLFILAGIWHLLVMLFVRPNNAGYEATFRVAAYSTVVYLVSWIPVIGWILSLYGIYLGIVGIREVHGTTTGKAALVVLIPIVVIGGLLLLIFGAVLIAVLAGTR
jgi:hypothetical protein